MTTEAHTGVGEGNRDNARRDLLFNQHRQLTDGRFSILITNPMYRPALPAAPKGITHFIEVGMQQGAPNFPPYLKPRSVQLGLLLKDTADTIHAGGRAIPQAERRLIATDWLLEQDSSIMAEPFIVKNVAGETSDDPQLNRAAVVTPLVFLTDENTRDVHTRSVGINVLQGAVSFEPGKTAMTQMQGAMMTLGYHFVHAGGNPDVASQVWGQPSTNGNLPALKAEGLRALSLTVPRWPQGLEPDWPVVSWSDPEAERFKFEDEQNLTADMVRLKVEMNHRVYNLAPTNGSLAQIAPRMFMQHQEESQIFFNALQSDLMEELQKEPSGIDGMSIWQAARHMKLSTCPWEEKLVIADVLRQRARVAIDEMDSLAFSVLLDGRPDANAMMRAAFFKRKYTASAMSASVVDYYALQKIWTEMAKRKSEFDFIEILKTELPAWTRRDFGLGKAPAKVVATGFTPRPQEPISDLDLTEVPVETAPTPPVRYHIEDYIKNPAARKEIEQGHAALILSSDEFLTDPDGFLQLAKSGALRMWIYEDHLEHPRYGHMLKTMLGEKNKYKLSKSRPGLPPWKEKEHLAIIPSTEYERGTFRAQEADEGRAIVKITTIELNANPQVWVPLMRKGSAVIDITEQDKKNPT